MVCSGSEQKGKRTQEYISQGYIPLAAYSIDSRVVTRDSAKSRFARVRKAFKAGALVGPQRVAVPASVNKGLRHSRSLLDRALLRPANLTRPIYFAITHKMQHFVSYTNYPLYRRGIEGPVCFCYDRPARSPIATNEERRRIMDETQSTTCSCYYYIRWICSNKEAAATFNLAVLGIRISLKISFFKYFQSLIMSFDSNHPILPQKFKARCKRRYYGIFFKLLCLYFSS